MKTRWRLLLALWRAKRAEEIEDWDFSCMGENCKVPISDLRFVFVGSLCPLHRFLAKKL